MKARIVRFAALSALVLIAAPGAACKHINRDERPLSRIDRDRGPLVLDGPGRGRADRGRSDEDRSLLVRSLPWNWFR